MQEIKDGDHNNQAGRDVNYGSIVNVYAKTIVLSNNTGIDNENLDPKNTTQGYDGSDGDREGTRRRMLPSKVFRLHHGLISVFFYFIFFATMMGMLYFRVHSNQFFYTIAIVASAAGAIWYFLPVKFPSLLSIVDPEYITYKGEKINYADVHEIQWWKDNQVLLKMFNGERLQFQFARDIGTEYFVDSFRLFSERK